VSRYRDPVHQFERRILQETMEAAQWNVRVAARVLDLAPQALYKILTRRGVKRPATATPQPPAARRATGAR
jgi:transcriptional regulator with GAF, ATPase, and Fis domain